MVSGSEKSAGEWPLRGQAEESKGRFVAPEVSQVTVPLMACESRQASSSAALRVESHTRGGGVEMGRSPQRQVTPL